LIYSDFTATDNLVNVFGSIQISTIAAENILHAIVNTRILCNYFARYFA